MAEERISAPRRRPDHGGYARGEETRARIIQAALEVFGNEGYERASTRAIARDAGVNPPALQYYFDSKEGLHRACAQYIFDQVGQTLPQALAHAAEIAAAGDAARAIDALCDLLDTIFDISIAAKEVPAWTRFMGRAHTDMAGPAALHVRETVARPIQLACAQLVGTALGRPADDDETKLRAVLVLSQLSACQSNRLNTMAFLGWSDFSGDRGAAVKAQLRAHTRAVLRA